jgi:hypothetical protein
LGQRIYREGIGASGEPLSAIGSARARLSGRDVACVACHRRSGYGTSEGRFFIRPITGPALREDLSVAVRSPRIKSRLGSRPRPAYTEATLARAIRKGVDSADKPLDPAMPRYAMSDAEMKAVAAYLFSLSERPSPGVDAQDIHFATVIQPGVAPERRRAMLEIMQAFVKDKDSNMRLEDRRRQVGNFRRYRAYRKWVLHVWELKGPSESWGEQLETYYRQQPVFALIGGLGSSSWRPVHEFSERFEIPCIFPQVDLPTLSGVNNYTVYLSKGVVLEAEVLAKFLHGKGAAKRVVQAYRANDAGAAAAAALRSALGADIALEDRVLEGSADGAFWQSVFGARADALVLWLDARGLSVVQSARRQAPRRGRQARRRCPPDLPLGSATEAQVANVAQRRLASQQEHRHHGRGLADEHAVRHGGGERRGGPHVGQLLARLFRRARRARGDSDAGSVAVRESEPRPRAALRREGQFDRAVG